MRKRGQVSVFFIIGIVALVAVILIFVLVRSTQEKARAITNPQEYLKSQINDIRKMINNCITDEANDALKDLSEGGGHLNPVRYAGYYDKKVTFLCYKVGENEPCYNMMFTASDIDDELKPRLENGISGCIDSGLVFFRNMDYNLSIGEFSLTSVFSKEALLVTLDYPITLSKETTEETDSSFSKEIKTNFWKVADVASSIINMEASGQEVNIPILSSSNQYFEIGRTQVSGGSLYILKSRNTDDPIFYFAVET